MEALAKYQTARAFLTSELQFLMNYTYDLGTDSLLELGAEQCVKSSWRWSQGCWLIIKLGLGCQVQALINYTRALSTMSICHS